MKTLEPAIRFERTTANLQGWSSTPELRRLETMVGSEGVAPTEVCDQQIYSLPRPSNGITSQGKEGMPGLLVPDRVRVTTPSRLYPQSGWSGRIRTYDGRVNSSLPCRLATDHQSFEIW